MHAEVQCDGEPDVSATSTIAPDGEMSAAERAYREIRRSISSGVYGGGVRLREEELGATLGLSRTPVRDALRRLHVEGFVELEPNRGARVAEWSHEDLEEIFELRLPIETLAARLAAQHIDEARIVQLEHLAQKMEDVLLDGDREHLDVVSDMNTEFHDLVVEASGNRRLARVREIVVQTPVVQSTFRRYDSVELHRSFREHRELIAALRDGDAELAAALMSVHVLAARRAYLGSAAS
jgi:DNA-binding GntR family transcriptional regulator